MNWFATSKENGNSSACSKPFAWLRCRPPSVWRLGGLGAYCGRGLPYGCQGRVCEWFCRRIGEASENSSMRFVIITNLNCSIWKKFYRQEKSLSMQEPTSESIHYWRVRS